MAKTITVSIENLLGYIKGHKLGHDNSVKQNTYLAYYKGQWYGHEYRQQENNNEDENFSSNDDENNSN